MKEAQVLTVLKGPFAAGPWDVFRNITGTTLPAICYGVVSKGLKRSCQKNTNTRRAPNGKVVLRTPLDMGVSKNRGTPKWMMENPIKMDDLGVPWFLETPICRCRIYKVSRNWFSTRLWDPRLFRSLRRVEQWRSEHEEETKLKETEVSSMSVFENPYPSLT